MDRINIIPTFISIFFKRMPDFFRGKHQILFLWLLSTPTLMSKAEIDAHIKLLFQKENRHLKNQKIIREAAAIIAYQQYCEKLIFY